MDQGTGPLAGIRVVDLTRLLPGPWCTWLLSSLGAEVIRVEPPGASDLARMMPPMVDGVGVYYAAVNRGKASVLLDWRDPAGLEAMMANYGNPLYRVPITFLEIFPVGLLVALISAALLRNPKVLPAKA